MADSEGQFCGGQSLQSGSGQISRPEHVTQSVLSPICVPHPWPMGTLDRSGGRGRCRKGHNIFLCGASELQGPSCGRVGTGKHGVRGVACVSMRGSGACVKRVGSVADPRASHAATPAA